MSFEMWETEARHPGAVVRFQSLDCDYDKAVFVKIPRGASPEQARDIIYSHSIKTAKTLGVKCYSVYVDGEFNGTTEY